MTTTLDQIEDSGASLRSRKPLRGVGLSESFCKIRSAEHAGSFDFHSKEHTMPTYDNLPKTSKFFKGKWFDKMVEDLRLAGKAKRTVYGYVRAI